MIPSDWEVQINRSRRRTIGVLVKGPGKLLVRAPFQASVRDIELFLEKVRPQLEKNMKKVEQVNNEAREQGYLTQEEINNLADMAMKVLRERVGYYAEIIGVSYGRITIRNQRTRWGSCSSKGNLNFNCLLMLAPKEVLDYVVVHELCHRLEMNHSERFWSLVHSAMPDYRKWDKWLNTEGSILLHRMTGEGR